MRWICLALIIVAALTSPLSAKESPPKRLIGTVPGPAQQAIAFNQDGSFLLTAGYLGLNVWDVKTLKPAGPAIKLPSGVFTTARFVNKSVVVIAIDVEENVYPENLNYNSYVNFWDARTGKALRDPMIFHNRCDTAVSPDGSHIAVQFYPEISHGRIDKNYQLRVIDVSSGKSTFNYENNLPMKSMKFSADNTRLLMLEEKEIFETNTSVWDIVNNKRIFEPVLRGDGSYGVYATGGDSAEFSPDSRRFSVGYERTFTVYDAVTGKPLLVVDPTVAPVPEALPWTPDGVSVHFTPDSKRILSSFKDNRLIDAATGKPLWIERREFRAVHAFGAESHRMAGWYVRRTENNGIAEAGVALWDVESHNLIAKWPVEYQPNVRRIAAISADGHFIAASDSATNQTYVYDVEAAIAK